MVAGNPTPASAYAACGSHVWPGHPARRHTVAIVSDLFPLDAPGPLSPLYPYNEPGQPVVLYEGAIGGLASGDVTGSVELSCNAGGVITDDEIRSLAISQRLLGTREIILIHHTDCGMLTFTDDAFKRSIQDETGIKPAWSAEAFGDLGEAVRQSIARIKASPFIPHTGAIRGFVFDVATGKLNEVG